METLLQDVKYGVRALARSPGFATAAILTLALAIGANTAIFSVVHGVLLRPLPYPEPQRIVQLWNSIPAANVSSFPLSAPEFDEYRANHSGLQHVAAFAPDGFNLTGEGDAERIPGAVVTSSFFAVMGATPQQGRTFTAEEDRPGADVVVISHGLWQRRFGGRPVLDAKLVLGGRARSVVGVMPPGFDFPEQADIWAPAGLDANAFAVANLGHQSWRVLARLKPGTSLQQAQSELEAVAARFYSAHPGFYDAKSPWKVTVASLPQQTVAGARTPLLVLLGAVGLVLLIACTNVANLLLARATGRRREVALRAALGAGSGRLVRQMLTESLLLALAGGVAGVLLGAWGVSGLLAVAPPGLPRLMEVHLDGMVLAFTLGVSLLAGIGFGIFPAWRAARSDPQEALRGAGRDRGGTRGAGRWLAAVQVALSLMLLTGAGLLLRSFWNLMQVEPGFQPDALLTARLSPPLSKYPTSQAGARLLEQVVARLQSAPGVLSAACTSALPFSGRSGRAAFNVENWTPEERARATNVHFRAVTPGYFRTLGVPLLSGRELSERDAASAPPVAVINRNMAQRYWPQSDPLGKRVSFEGPQGPWIEIVGVVGNVQHMGLDAEAVQEIFLPYEQQPFGPGQGVAVVVRGTGSEATALAATLRAEVAQVDSDLPVYGVRPMTDLLDLSVATRRFQMLLLVLFATVAVAMAAVGAYGVIAYSATLRTAEYGIRMALGAQRGDVLRLVLREGAVIAAAGLAGGLAGSLAATRLVQGLLFNVQASDPLTLAAVALLMTMVVLVAAYVPARRAARTDPMVALRYE
jgi:putative ABC transport system permease protein